MSRPIEILQALQSNCIWFHVELWEFVLKNNDKKTALLYFVILDQNQTPPTSRFWPVGSRFLWPRVQNLTSSGGSLCDSALITPLSARRSRGRSYRTPPIRCSYIQYVPVWRGLPAHSLPVYRSLRKVTPLRTTRVLAQGTILTSALICSAQTCRCCTKVYQKSIFAGLLQNTGFTANNTHVLFWTWMLHKQKSLKMVDRKKDTKKADLLYVVLQVVSTGHQLFNRHFSVKEKIIELETTCWCACPEISVLTHFCPYAQVQVHLGLHLSRCAAVCCKSSGTVRNVHLAEDIQWGLCTA